MVLNLVLLSSIIVPIIAAPDVISLNKDQYYVGDTLTVTVSGGTASGLVMLQINDPDNVPRWAVQGQFSAGGGYTYTLIIPSGWQDGTWKIYVKDGATTYEKTFLLGSVTPSPLNTSPKASFTVSKTTIVEGDSVSFDGSASNDPDGIIVSYSWDFGDGSTGSGKSVSHTYNTVGVYTVILTVRDNLAAADSMSATVTVNANQKPVADAGSSRTIFVGRDVDFDGSGSSDPDGTITKYEWDFGDGASGTGVVTSHSYSAKGTYTVTLTVTDNKGATGTASLTVTAEELPVTVKSEVETKFNGTQTDAVIDASATMGVKVKLNTTGNVSVDLIEYETNPHPEVPLPPNTLAKYIDISVSNPDAVAWPMYVEVHYTVEEALGLDETKFVLYYFSGGSWHACSNTGVDTVNNIVWAWLTREEAAGSPLVIGKTPAAAQFTYSNLSVSPAQVNVGGTVTVQVTVRNIGDLEGSTTVDLLVNGVKEQSKAVTLAVGASTTVSFSVTKSAAVSYTVKVGDLTGSFTVIRPLTPAAFTFSGLVVSPADVAPGAEVTVSVSVKNTGELSGTYSAELKFDGATKETKTGTLTGGASATVTFKVSSQAEGTHTVQVGTQTGSFKVTKPVTPPPTAPDYTWYIIGAVVVIVIVVAVYLLMRRKPQGVAP
jgi:PKD repeat protein